MRLLLLPPRRSCDGTGNSRRSATGPLLPPARRRPPAARELRCPSDSGPLPLISNEALIPRQRRYVVPAEPRGYLLVAGRADEVVRSRIRARRSSFVAQRSSSAGQRHPRPPWVSSGRRHGSRTVRASTLRHHQPSLRYTPYNNRKVGVWVPYAYSVTPCSASWPLLFVTCTCTCTS